MSPTALSLTARTLYAELRELALAIGATENLGEAPGTVVRKTVRGNSYLYFQYRDLSGNTKQTYLGADDEATRNLARRLRERIEYRAEDMQRLTELRAAFIGAGGFAAQHAPVRVLKAFADAGILRPGDGLHSGSNAGSRFSIDVFPSPRSGFTRRPSDSPGRQAKRPAWSSKLNRALKKAGAIAPGVAEHIATL